jgi:hypothetical protein
MPCRAVGLTATLVTAGLAGACSDPGGCTLNIVPAVAVEVRDASTDDFIAGLVQGVVADGAFEDSLRVVASLGTDPALPTTLGGADERAGTYAVHLEGSGYEAWDTANVQATRDACHVRTATFTARLTPTAP